MGKPVITLGSTSTGHDGYFPVNPTQASPNVRAVGAAIVRMGDTYAPHTRPKSPPHVGKATSGSTVRVNGKPAQRNGDMNSCGDHAANGKPNVRFG